jgi:hypothetical protein
MLLARVASISMEGLAETGSLSAASRGRSIPLADENFDPGDGDFRVTNAILADLP